VGEHGSERTCSFYDGGWKGDSSDQKRGGVVDPYQSKDADEQGEKSRGNRRKEVSGVGGRLITIGNFHLTLKLLGDQCVKSK